MTFDSAAGGTPGTGQATEWPTGAGPGGDRTDSSYVLGEIQYSPADSSARVSDLKPVRQALADPAEFGELAVMLTKAEDDSLLHIYEAVLRASRYRADIRMPEPAEDGPGWPQNAKNTTDTPWHAERAWQLGSCLVGLARMPEHWPHIKLLLQSKTSR